MRKPGDFPSSLLFPIRSTFWAVKLCDGQWKVEINPESVWERYIFERNSSFANKKTIVLVRDVILEQYLSARLLGKNIALSLPVCHVVWVHRSCFWQVSKLQLSPTDKSQFCRESTAEWSLFRTSRRLWNNPSHVLLLLFLPTRISSLHFCAD